MKYYLKCSKSALALLLVFCLLASIIPGVCFAASAAQPRAGGDPIPVATSDELIAAIEKCNQNNGGTIEIAQGRYEFYEPLRITSIITIQATGSCLLQCAGPNWTTGAVSPTSSLHKETRGRFFCLGKT